MSFNYTDIKSEIDSIDALIADYKSFEITAPTIAELQAFIAGLQETIERQGIELDRAQQRERDLTSSKDEIAKDVADRKEEITSTLQLLNQYELRIATLEANAQVSASDNTIQLDALRADRDQQLQDLNILKGELAESKAFYNELKQKLKMYREHIAKLQEENRTSRLMMLDANEQQQKRERPPSYEQQVPRPAKSRRGSAENLSGFEDVPEAKDELSDDGIDLARIQRIEDILVTTVTPATKLKNLEKPRFTKAELTYALKRRGRSTDGLVTNNDLMNALANL